jgi:hypothetical protein
MADGALQIGGPTVIDGAESSIIVRCVGGEVYCGEVLTKLTTAEGEHLTVEAEVLEILMYHRHMDSITEACTGKIRIRIDPDIAQLLREDEVLGMWTTPSRLRARTTEAQ